MSASENQIVVYQPNETVRLDVRLENETVWLTQSQMGELFGCTTRNVSMHLDNIYSCGELAPEGTRKDFFLVRLEGSRQVRRTVTCYNLDAIKKGVPKHLISPADISTFNAQYPKLAVRYNESFHDRFLIIDDKELYLIGASLKDLGSKCFAFTKLDAGEIRRIKATAFSPN